MRTSSIFAFLFLCTLAVAFPHASAAPVTNEDVVKMVRAGLSDPTILEAISAGQPQFDTSATAIIELKKAGVSEQVISRMLAAHRGSNQPTASESSRDSGCDGPQDRIWIVDSGRRHDAFPERADITGESSAGRALLSIFTSGLVSQTSYVRASMAGSRSALRVDSNTPAFENIAVKATLSPAEAFKLVRLTVEQTRRVVNLAKTEAGLLTGARVGEDKDATLELKFERGAVCNVGGQQVVGMRVTPSSPLGPGEYAFIAGKMFFSFGVD